MHGEFKPPGGKLVGAAVEVAGGELARVQISGDFFLEPDGALGRLNAALTGIPAAEDVPVMTGRITTALGGDAVLAGFTRPAAGAITTGGSSGMSRRIPRCTITYSLYAPESLVAGQGRRTTVPRFHFALRDVTQLHADIGWFVGALAVALAIGLHFTGAPRRRRSGPAASCSPTWSYSDRSATLGTSATCPPGLAWVHVSMSAVLWILVLRLHLSTRECQPCRPSRRDQHP